MQSTITIPSEKKGSIVSFFHFLAGFTISKRQRFIISVILLTLGLFFSANTRFSQGEVLITSFSLAIFTVLLLYWSNFKDINGNFSPSLFILPFFFSLAFSFFYFLPPIPDRLLFRLLVSIGYGIGLYSLFLSQNIFIVASIRTIALLSSARLVSTVLTTIAYILLSLTIFSLHLFLFQTALIVFVYSFFLITHALWIYSLETRFFAQGIWVALLSLCLFELALILWFWPSLPAFIAIFLTGFFYSVVGLSHLWMEKRLFKGSLWEYVWLTMLTFCILLFFTYFS
jgi:hypothetical protein